MHNEELTKCKVNKERINNGDEFQRKIANT